MPQQTNGVHLHSESEVIDLSLCLFKPFLEFGELGKLIVVFNIT